MAASSTTARAAPITSPFLPLPSSSVLVGALTVLAFALRVVTLDQESLWFDTAHSGVVALNPNVAEVVRGAASDFQSPLYFVLLHYWLQVSHSDFWLRLLTVAVGTALVSLTYLVGRRLFSTHVGMVAALFSALTTYQVYYARYPRGYILLALFGLLAAYWLHRALEDGRARWWVLHGLAVLLAVYTHPYAFFLLPGLWGYGLWRCLRQPAMRPALLMTVGLSLAAYLPWLGVSWGQWGQVQAGADNWIEPASRDALKTLYDWLWFRTRWEYGLAGDVLLRGGRYLFSLLMLWALWRGRRSEQLWYVVLLALTPVVVAFAFSVLVQPLWDPRYLVLISPFFALWLGYSLAGLLQHASRGVRYMGVGALALLVIMAIPPLMSLYKNDAFFSPALRESVAWVRDQHQVGDLIVHVNYQSYLPALWYDQQWAASHGVAAGRFSVPCVWASLPDAWCSAAPYPQTYVNLEFQSFRQVMEGLSRIWLIVLYNQNKVGDEQRAEQLAEELAGQEFLIGTQERFLGVNVYELRRVRLAQAP